VNGHKVGEMGVLHPLVLHKFDIIYPVELLELNIEKIKTFALGEFVV